MRALTVAVCLALAALASAQPEPDQQGADLPEQQGADLKDVEPEAAPEEAACVPCAPADDPVATIIREQLSDAFELSMVTGSCAGASNLQRCRELEGLIEDSFEKLRGMMTAAEQEGSIDCIGCDPRPHLAPLFASFEALFQLLLDKGYDEFEATERLMMQELELWKGYSCCAQSPTQLAGRPRNREADARDVLREKCGANFVRNRQGLRQVVRMPGDRQGCYQSRACRSATEYSGAFMEAGFWTYDGEYWYVWAERLTPRGEWVRCNP